jgi:glutamine amidotransferase
MTQKVTLVDYGVGNLRSVRRALEYVGGVVTVAHEVADILQAERLVLPGVGAFGHCMTELQQRGFTDALSEYVARERPFMGICVGMQIMLSYGEEFGEHRGLNFIPGRVVKIPQQRQDATNRVLPYVGWAALRHSTTQMDWKGSVLGAVSEGEYGYFLHSFSAVPDDPSTCLAEYDYESLPICAAIRKAHLTGVQFHPEKSADTGLRILRQFLAM